MLGNCLFGAVKLIKNAGPDKYRYSAYDFGFDEYSQFSWADGCWGKNVIILGIHNSSSVHVNKKNIY